jgi:mono/diheme cytochrome c family protein
MIAPMRNAILSLVAVVFLVASPSPAQSVRGDAGAGKLLFQNLKCAVCHSVNGVGGKSAPALGGPGYTPNRMAAAMWSHVSTMWNAMDREGIQRPQLTERQAADLYAFFAGGYNPDRPGDAKLGGKIYEAKLCASCHDAEETGVPRLAGRAGEFSPFSLVASLLRHGRGMLSRMVAKDLQWQQLSADEMGNLIAYLNAKK